jgi:hypothetical protein
MTPDREIAVTPSVAADRPGGRSADVPGDGRPVIGRQALRYGVALVLLVTAASLLISAQGWKSRMLAFDLLPYMYGTHELLESGALPQHGDTGSYGSYKPPGTAWLMLPGAVLLGDPRAVAYVGTGILHFATLLGILLLAGRCFGLWPACLAVVLYGLSKHGIFLAGSLWPNGRPDFYVWLVLFTMLWALRRDGRYLAAALGVWGLGMYVDMALAPALFILPVVWLLYRPPVRPAPVLIAGLLLLTVWSPYLRLEATRGFADVKSMLFLRYILPSQPRQSWCDPSLTLSTWRQPIASAAASGTDRGPADAGGPVGLATRLGMLKEKVLSNFSHAVLVPGADVVLLVLVLGTMILSAGPDGPIPEAPAGESRLLRRKRLARVGMTLMVAAMLLQGIVSGFVPGAALLPASGVLRKLPQVLFLVGLSLSGIPWLLRATQRVLRRRGIELHPNMPMRLLVISLGVPWSMLVILAEPGKPERFWWVWPIQVIFLAAAVAYVLPRLPVPRPLVGAAQLLLAAGLLINSTLVGRFGSWRADGWAGRDPEEVRVVDYVAQQVRADGKSEAAVGYQLFIYPFMAEYHVTNPIYRAGAELELMLRYRHDIANTDRCAEGISPTDEYRIVQRRPTQGLEAPRHYFDVPMDKGFRLLRRFGLYDVFKRG